MRRKGGSGEGGGEERDETGSVDVTEIWENVSVCAVFSVLMTAQVEVINRQRLWFHGDCHELIKLIEGDRNEA